VRFAFDFLAFFSVLTCLAAIVGSKLERERVSKKR
jgi:hypothetical protein